MPDLLETVRTTAGLESPEEARAGAHAALRALGARVANVDAVAVELPDAEAAELRRKNTGEASPGGIAELTAATQAELGASGDAANVLQATLRGLVELLPPETLLSISEQLPADITELLQPEQQGDTVELHANAPRPGQPGLAVGPDDA